MRTIRCFVDEALSPGRGLILPEGVSGHLHRVLRLGAGARIQLFNGDGHDYDSEIVLAGKRGCEVVVGEARAVDNESPLRIHLLQGIARGEKMDLILQKATELGVAQVTPVVTERTEVRLDAERAPKRHAHWLGVIRAACEQSGRAVVPQLHEARPLPQALAAGIDGAGFVLEPSASVSLSNLVFDAPVLTLLIGPEGGLGDGDLHAASAAGLRGLRLGPRILRTETAGLAAIGALQARFGDLG